MPKLGTPKIGSSCGADVFYHSSTLTVWVPPLPEDADPDLVIETVWEKSTRQRSLYRKIESAGTSREYHPNIDDQECFIRAGVTLVNPDGIRGITVFSSPVFITVDPKIKKEVDSNVEVSVAIFKVLAKMCDQDCLKRLLFLNKRHLKIRKKDTTIFKCRWNTEQLSILPHSSNSIIISFPGESNTIITVELVAPDTFHRDIIYLTLIRFQAENMGPSRLSFSIPSSSGANRHQYISSGSR